MFLEEQGRIFLQVIIFKALRTTLINSFPTAPLTAQPNHEKLAKCLENVGIGVNFRESYKTLANNITKVGTFRNHYLCLFQARNHSSK